VVEQKALSVRIDADLHARVRRRAFDESVAVEALLRGWLAAYAEGSLLADGVRVAPAVGVGSSPKPVRQPATTGARGVRTETCPHRVASGQFCKRCDGEGAA